MYGFFYATNASIHRRRILNKLLLLKIRVSTNSCHRDKKNPCTSAGIPLNH